MARVFISFVHEDESIAASVQRLIQQELDLGAEVFLSSDESQVYGGEIWLNKIREALEQCEVLVLMLSGRSMRRAWVHFEAGAVWLQHRPVIPVCFGLQTIEALPHPYSGMKALTLPADAHYLVTSVHHALALSTSPPPSPTFRRIANAARAAAAGALSVPGIATVRAMIDPYELLESALVRWQDALPQRRLGQ